MRIKVGGSIFMTSEGFPFLDRTIILGPLILTSHVLSNILLKNELLMARYFVLNCHFFKWRSSPGCSQDFYNQLLCK
jgi:hypothetical protein